MLKARILFALLSLGSWQNTPYISHGTVDINAFKRFGIPRKKKIGHMYTHIPRECGGHVSKAISAVSYKVKSLVD